MQVTVALAWLLIALLAALLAAACIADARERRIPNWVCVIGAVFALAWHTFAPPGHGLFSARDPGGLGVWQSTTGALAAFVVFLALRALRIVGAGDVKLVAMLGAVFGLEDVPRLVLSVFAAGGVLALVRIALGGRGRKVVENLRMMVLGTAARLAGGAGPTFDPAADTADRMPYAFALSLGACALAIQQHLA